MVTTNLILGISKCITTISLAGIFVVRCPSSGITQDFMERYSYSPYLNIFFFFFFENVRVLKFNDFDIGPVLAKNSKR